MSPVSPDLNKPLTVYILLSSTFRRINVFGLIVQCTVLAFTQNLGGLQLRFACGREAKTQKRFLKTTQVSLAYDMSSASCFRVAGGGAGRRVSNVTAESAATEKTTGQQSTTVGPEQPSTSEGAYCAPLKHL